MFGFQLQEENDQEFSCGSRKTVDKSIGVSFKNLWLLLYFFVLDFRTVDSIAFIISWSRVNQHARVLDIAISFG